MDPIGVTSLALQLFNGALQLYNIYGDTQESGNKFVRQRVLLHIQEQRYRNWGELVGLDKGNFSPPKKPTQIEVDLTLDVLAQISEILVAASNLEGKYQKSVKSMQTVLESSEVTASTLTDRQLQHRRVANEVKSRIISGLKFALWDKDKFEGFNRDLTLLIDGLESLTGPYRKKLEAMLYTQMLQTESKDGLLALGNATHSTAGILSELATRKVSYLDTRQRQLNSKSAKKFDPGNDPFKLKKSDIDLEHVSGASARDFGTYQSQTPIMIEWKVASEQLSENEVLQRISDIADFLSTSLAAGDTHLPRCLGYYSEPGNTHRIALVYEVTGGPHRTLAEAIPKSAFENISLGTRYRLALALAESVFYLHLTGWLHKGIRSSNILMFGESTSAGVSSQLSLLLAGFTTARLEGPLVTSEKTSAGPREELFHHPDYQQENKHDTGYNFAFDIYSLGVCLLEIAMWRPIDELGGYKPKKHSPTDFARKLSGKSSLGLLDFTVGIGYRRAVEWCLTGSKAKVEISQAGSKQDSQAMEFWDRVVLELGNCCVAE